MSDLKKESDIDVDAMSAEELYAKREEIRRQILAFPGAESNPDIPVELLRLNVLVTSAMRKKNAGPPKKPKGEAKTKTPKTAADLLNLL